MTLAHDTQAASPLANEGRREATPPAAHHPNRDVGRRVEEACAECRRAGVWRFGPHGDYVLASDWAHPPYPPAFHDPKRWERRCDAHRIVRAAPAPKAPPPPAGPKQGRLAV